MDSSIFDDQLDCFLGQKCAAVDTGHTCEKRPNDTDEEIAPVTVGLRMPIARDLLAASVMTGLGCIAEGSGSDV